MTNQMKGVYNPPLNKHSSEMEQHFSGMTMWFKRIKTTSPIDKRDRYFVAFKDKECTKAIFKGPIWCGDINFD